jgi:hypothetical protein
MRQENNLTSSMSRFNTITCPERVYLDDPADVMGEIKNLILLIYKKFDFSEFEQVFGDVINLFNGHYPGYRRCNTFYHDLSHTMDCLLVTAKLIHGACINGIFFEPRDVNLGLISALMHDTGYIQAVDDNTGTGAKYTACHIERSIEFMEKYFHDKNFPAAYLPICRDFLRCTGLDVKIGEIKFDAKEHEILGKILGAADLIGQMANDNYLDKLPFLYDEFKEAGVPGYNNKFDLLKKTPAFWEMVKKRLMHDLGAVDRYLRDYLRVLWGIDEDLYREAIDQNMERLQSFLSAPRPTFQGIRRASVKWV